ncbi:MAG: HXXEE domain-containing protein [Anaerolineales bacterium]|nr:HXXEE domain-containing protein [Anaerolineales bacterium]
MGQIDFLAWLWIFVGAFALHELEEWNILHWYQRNYTDLPPSSHKAVRLWIIFVILIGVAWCAAATIPGNPVFAAYVFLPAIAVVMQNALQHIYWLIFFRQYAPGIITAAFCLIPLGIYIANRAVQENLAPIWYVGILILLIIPGLVQTVKAKNKMTKPIRAIHHIGIRLSELLDRLA